MGLVVVVVAGALLLALITGGRLSDLTSLRFRQGRLLGAAVAVQAGGTAFGVLGWSGTGWTYPAALALAAVLLTLFAIRNPTLLGLPLVALGLALNAIVVGANGAMPVSIYAAAKANISTGAIADDARHDIAGPDTSLRPLGDDIPVLLPLRAEVVSAGDCLVAAGLGLLVFSGLRRRLIQS